MKKCSKNVGAAAEDREKIKIDHYEELANNYLFVPIAVETFGTWGSHGYKLIKEIGKKVMEVTGERRSTFFLTQSISMAIQRGNASCVLGTLPPSESLDEIFEFVTNTTPEDSS